MKKTLYLMRHGQTLFNIRRKVQGCCDSPLTELGIKQAETASKYFKENNIILIMPIVQHPKGHVTL